MLKEEDRMSELTEGNLDNDQNNDISECVNAVDLEEGSETKKEDSEIKKSIFDSPLMAFFVMILLMSVMLYVIGYTITFIAIYDIFKDWTSFGKNTVNTVSELRPFEEDTQKYPKPLTVQDKKKLILQSMKDKYKEEFVGYKWDDKTEDYFRYGKRFILYPKNGTEDDRFRVEIDYDSEYNYYFFDNYFEIVIRDRYREYIEHILNELYPEYFLTIRRNSDHVYSGRFNKDIKINEIYQPNRQRYGTSISIYISERLLNNKGISENAYQIAERMLQHNIDCRIYLYVVKNSKYDYFREKKGEVYPDKKDPNFYIKREQIDNEFYIREGNMKREYYNIMILPNEENELLEIRIGTENKEEL